MTVRWKAQTLSFTSTYVNSTRIVQFQSSGGIGSFSGYRSYYTAAGVAGVIVGRALLDGKFTAEEAFACWQSE